MERMVQSPVAFEFITPIAFPNSNHLPAVELGCIGTLCPSHYAAFRFRFTSTARNSNRRPSAAATRRNIASVCPS